MQEESPTPGQPTAPKEAMFPICPGCKTELDQVRYLDFDQIRVVFHTKCGMTVGTLVAN